MENDNQTCDNCKFFLVHYIKCGNGTFITTSSGHCVNRNRAFKQSDRIVRIYRTCELWEPVEIKIQERKCSIIKRIEYMESHLSQIKQILKEDCKHSDAQNSISES